jgi:hypothetical protein
MRRMLAMGRGVSDGCAPDQLRPSYFLGAMRPEGPETREGRVGWEGLEAEEAMEGRSPTLMAMC